VRDVDRGKIVNSKALIAATAMALLGACLLLVYKRRFEAAAVGGAPVAVLVALQDVAPGTPLEASMLGKHEIPEAYVEPGRHIKVEDLPKIVGVRVGAQVKANTSLMWSDVGTAREQRELSSLVKPGSRAYTVRTDDSTGLGALLRPGDYVDVLASISEGEARATLPITQRKLVLAVGQDIGGIEDPGARTAKSSAKQVTISVEAKLVPVIAAAADRGKITLVVRNPEDVEDDGRPDATVQDIDAAERRLREANDGHAP
jgi:pilus assembly protein CpaB